MTPARFSSFIRQRAQELDISISELSERAQISRQAYYCLEKNPQNMRLTTLLTLANALEIHPQQLLQLIFEEA